MSRDHYNALTAFVAVASEHSFTRAAARLGVSQSALSHTVTSLEASLGVRLLTRTTRSVTTTDAGERLLVSLAPRFAEIDAEIASLMEMRDKPAGTIRIAAPEHAATMMLWPKIARFMKQHPDIKIELSVENALQDIVAGRFDAGVRLGEQVAKDMIATRIGPDQRMVAVGAPAYFEKHGMPETPQSLTAFDCINLRLPTLGDLYAWEFEKNGRKLNVRVEGQLVLNRSTLIARAAVAGLGIAYLPMDMVRTYLDSGRLVHVLGEWSPVFPGYHLYYPSRRQASPAFKLLLEALRYKV